MESISQADVDKIAAEAENSKNITFKLKNGRILTQGDIFLYGQINLKDEKDIKLLESFENKIWDWTTWNHKAYSDVNYKNGDVYYNEAIQGYRWYSMVDLIKWIRYNMLLINNPKRVIIYRIPKTCM